MVSHYIIYIYIYTYIEFNWILDSLVFALNNSLVTKIKKLDGQVAQNWDVPNIYIYIYIYVCMYVYA